MATAVSDTARLKLRYYSEIRAKLQKELGLANVHEAPHLEKIVINVGVGKAKDDKRHMELAANTLGKITGQHPVELSAKKSIAGFKIRRGQNKIGIKVTLRGRNMYEFLDRLVNVVLPRVRDFHGVSPDAFDPQGNYSLGLREQSVFPELSYEDIAALHGLQVNFVINAKTPAHARALLESFGMPFQKRTKE